MAEDGKRAGKAQRIHRKRAGGQAARHGHALRIGRVLPREVRDIYRRRGFLHHELIARWPLIVGADLADKTLPLKIRHPKGRKEGGTLELKVAPGFALMVQHESPRLVAAVNRHFGRRAVARIAIQQGPIPASPPPPRREDRRPSPDAVDKAQGLARGIADPAIAALIARWGALVLSAQNPHEDAERPGGRQNGTGQKG